MGGSALAYSLALILPLPPIFLCREHNPLVLTCPNWNRLQPESRPGVVIFRKTWQRDIWSRRLMGLGRPQLRTISTIPTPAENWQRCIRADGEIRAWSVEGPNKTPPPFPNAGLDIWLIYHNIQSIHLYRLDHLLLFFLPRTPSRPPHSLRFTPEHPQLTDLVSTCPTCLLSHQPDVPSPASYCPTVLATPTPNTSRPQSCPLLSTTETINSALETPYCPHTW